MKLRQYKEFLARTFPALILPNHDKNRPDRPTEKTSFRLKSKLSRAISSPYHAIVNKLATDIIKRLEAKDTALKINKMCEIKAKLCLSGGELSLPDDFDLIGHEFIRLGSGFQANRGLRLHCWQTETLENISSPNLQIGDRVFFNREAYVSCANSIRIGSDSLFGSNVLITDNYHGSTKEINMARLQSPLSCPADVEIGDGVWVGNNVCILPGARIGQGSIIGANSVVNSTIPAFSVAVGSPARIVGSLATTKPVQSE
jgi:acetyltransferase-like isoleucine patch superfamily enzyme